MDDEVIPVETEKPPKERVKLTHSTWAKVGAIVLLYVSLIFVIACVICFILSAMGGASDYQGVLDSIDRGLKGWEIVYGLAKFASGLYAVSVLVGIVFLALALACMVFLFCAAGHRKGETEPRLNMVDRIPLDIYAAAVIIIDLFLAESYFENRFGIYVRYNAYNYLMEIQAALFLLAVVCFAFGLVLALLLSFATRVKCGKWWRNTVIYRILRLIWRVVKAVWYGIGRFGRMIPIVWRTALIMLGLFTIGFILFILMYDQSGSWLLIGLLYAIVIYAAAIFGAWQMKSIKKAGQQLAEGNYNEKIDTRRMYWEFKSHAENLNSIGDGLSKEVAQRMKSERLKTELITNVSHDIKTPLTSIINYVDLLQKAGTEEERREYLAVLDRQSHRLKKLTEDLVEASKASSGSLPVHPAPTDVNVLLSQLAGDYMEKLEDAQLEPIFRPAPSQPVIQADGQLLSRVLGNLFSNICKYAMPGTRVYFESAADENTVSLTFKNISKYELNIPAEELMARFVRGDRSRHTEGSGLGLSIAQSLTELQGGTFRLEIDGDLFKAVVTFPREQTELVQA